MVRYAIEPDQASRTAKSRGSHLRIHFKHCREILHHIKGMQVNKAQKFMDDVLAFKTCVPFRKYTGGIGHHAQAKLHKAPGSKGRWPVKATAVLRDLLANAVSNAETKGLDTEQLIVSHCQANRAPPGRRRTYRAHGRIGKYASQPAHCEIILTEKKDDVAKADDDEEEVEKVRIPKRLAARKRFVKVGGGSSD